MINTIPFGGHQVVEKEGKTTIIPISPQIVLREKGAIIPVNITHPRAVASKLSEEGKPIPSIRCNALIDTGASLTVISPRIADELKLVQTGFQKITSVQDQQDRPEYYAFVQFGWGTGKEVPVVSCPLNGGFDCLIGRDIMMHWNFTYNGRDGYIIICD